jgi:acyl-CoA synthetase (AMP-forming)/AMP-acid ligase II
LSFAELDTITAGGVDQLGAAGLEPGDTVLFFHPVSIELYTALLSVFRAGMTAMFIDPSAGRPFIDACCALRRPQAFFGSPKAHLLRLASRELRQIPVKIHSRCPWLPGSRRWTQLEGERDTPATITDAPALITFTSGSTGRPKAVARSHAFLIAQHAALQNALQLQPGEIDLITLPVFTLANLGSGLTSVLADTDLAKPGEADAETIARQIAAAGVQRVAASPAFFEAVLEKPEALAPLKRIATGGAPVFPPLLDRLVEAAPEAKVFAVYGSTEAEPIAHVEHGEITTADLDRMRRGGGLLVGKPVPEIELRIIADQWGEPVTRPVDLPAGQIGEIVVSGDHVLSGYLNRTGDEETKFRTSGDQIWHRCGDAGWLDAEGRLWLMGRCAAKLSGGKLYPFAVECALSFFPQLRRCAAVEHAGLKILVLQFHTNSGDDNPLDEIREAVAWAGFDRVMTVKSIPVDRRHQAKVDYPRLHQLLRAELD